MSTNLSTTTEKLDLSLSDSVPIEDQNEVSRVSITESSIKISVSVTEISSNEVKVTSEGESLVENLRKSSDLLVEGNLGKEVGAVLDDSVLPKVGQSEIEVVKESLRVSSLTSVEKIEVVREEFEVMEKEEVSDGKNEVSEISNMEENVSCVGKDGSFIDTSSRESKESIQEEKRDDENRCSEVETVDGRTGPHSNGDFDKGAVITESLVEQVHVSEGGEVANTETEEVVEMREVVSGAVDLGENLSAPQKSQAPGEESTVSHGHFDNTFVVDEKQETVPQVSKALSSQSEENEKLDPDTVEENPNKGVCVTVDSIFSTESQETRIEIAEAGESRVINELQEDVSTAIPSNEAHVLGENTGSSPNKDLPRKNDTSAQAKKQDTDAEVAEAHVSEDTEMETRIEVANKESSIDTIGGKTETFPSEDLVCDVNNSIHEGKQEMAAEVPETVSNQVSRDTAKENLIEDDYVIVDSDLLPGISKESQATGSYVASFEATSSLLDVKSVSEVVATDVRAPECEITMISNEEVPKEKDDISGTGVLDEKVYFSEEDQEAETVSRHAEDHTKINCVTVDSGPIDMVVHECQATGGYQESEVQVHASVLPEDRNVETHVSDVNTSPGMVNQTAETVVTTEPAGGSSAAERCQVMDSHFSLGNPDNDLSCDDEVVRDITPADDSHGKGDETKESESERTFTLDCVDDDLEDAESMEQQPLKTEVLNSEITARYLLELGNEGEFSISDLVWGKVRSHPWWPGQIFNSSDASDQAMKYHKKDNYLVAYFGDQTFAWNEASAMKSFRAHFSQMEKQNSTEAFRDAVNGALNEVRRRVELGMSCSCTPEEAYADLKFQIVENPGIREEARERHTVVDKYLSGTSFRPDNLVQYIKDLALNPRGGGDRLELLVAQSQIMAFYRSKGVFRLPEFHMYNGLSESNLDLLPLGDRNNSEEADEFATPFSENQDRTPSIGVKQKNQDITYHKRKRSPDDYFSTSWKERSLSDLMAGKNNGHSLAEPGSPAPQSFKVGDCIRRIASKLTGAPPILKSGGDSSLQTHEKSNKKEVTVPKEYSSPDEMLSQLCLAARDPLKGYSFLTDILSFFTDFRNSISSESSSSSRHKKSEKIGVNNRKALSSKISSAETFDFEDTGDAYWTDRIVQSNSDEEPVVKKRNRKEKTEIQRISDEEPVVKSRKRKAKTEIQATPQPTHYHPPIAYKVQNPDGSYTLPSKKSSGNNQKRKMEGVDPQNLFQDSSDHDRSVKKQSNSSKKRKSELQNTISNTDDDQLTYFDLGQEMSLVDPFAPAALLLSFSDSKSVPSEANLNKILRRFGPLKESETEVERSSNTAMVVFKTRNDAEVACSSAEKFNIFGPVSVSYRLSEFPLPAPEPSLPSTPQAPEDTIPLEENEIDGSMLGLDFPMET